MILLPDDFLPEPLRALISVPILDAAETRDETILNLALQSWFVSELLGIAEQLADEKFWTGSDGNIDKAAAAVLDQVSALETEVQVAGFYDAYVHVQDRKSGSGGTFTSGAWRPRDINTLVADTAGIASIDSNYIILPAGTWLCAISCPAFDVDLHKARLWDYSASAVVLEGTSEYCNPSSGQDQSRSIINGMFTLTEESNLLIQHRCYTTSSGAYGFGNSTTFGDYQIYTDAQFWRLS